MESGGRGDLVRFGVGWLVGFGRVNGPSVYTRTTPPPLAFSLPPTPISKPPSNYNKNQQQNDDDKTHVPQVQVRHVAARLEGARGVREPQGCEQLPQHLLYFLVWWGWMGVGWGLSGWVVLLLNVNRRMHVHIYIYICTDSQKQAKTPSSLSSLSFFTLSPRPPSCARTPPPPCAASPAVRCATPCV